MGPGFKYHVVTVVSIFLALTIGLVIGSLVSPRLVDKQARFIERLQKTVDNDNETLRQKNKRWEKFGELVTPALIRERLDGTTVAIIQLGDYPELLERVRATLELAGVKVASVTSVESGFNQLDAKIAPNLQRLHEEEKRFPADKEGVARWFATLLAQGSKGQGDLMEAMQKQNLLRPAPDSDYDKPIKYVIVLAGSRSETTNRRENVDRPLFKALAGRELHVIACEPLDALASDIPFYQNMDLKMATVDNVDTDMGRTALIFALRGDKDHYGVKPTANNLLPGLTIAPEPAKNSTARNAEPPTP